jgi:archaellum component FlaF (FlaF/FlaG flagellin family)
MTIFEIEKLLPNGFHDTVVHSIEINYESKKATFIITPLDNNEIKCEVKKIKLILNGLTYLTIDPPDSKYPYQKNNSICVDLSDDDKYYNLAKVTNTNNFTGRFFVYGWNSFIHVAAEAAELQKII